MLLALAIILIALNIADAVTTYMALKRIANAVEANPIMGFLIGKLGLIGALIAKMIVVFGVTYAAYDYGQPWLFAVLCAMYIFIVYNNVKIIRSN
jgi:uncharacterized protein YacL